MYYWFTDSILIVYKISNVRSAELKVNTCMPIYPYIPIEPFLKVSKSQIKNDLTPK